ITSLLTIPPHPHIIPLYNSFLLLDSKELCFVFEPMEGHLFQLIKSCRGHPFTGGLLDSHLSSDHSWPAPLLTCPSPLAYVRYLGLVPDSLTISLFHPQFYPAPSKS
ncbi:hypothetical protein EI94DRAFT_1910872, partial [Lactarius quietus]